jgi:Alternative complex III, ActD subunit
MSRRTFIGFFEDEHELLDAARECREREIPILDVVSPFPIHGLDDVLGIKPSRLPWVTLIGGAAGLSLGLWFQYWSTSVSFPIDVGGKPWDSFPAFAPVAFEMTILFAGLSTAFALFGRSCLFPGKKTTPGLELTTDHRHALILEQKDARFLDSDLEQLLAAHGAAEVRQDCGDES